MNITACKDDFLDFEGHVWLNAASEGPLPIVAARALEEAVVWKSKPHLLGHDKFASVPLRLKDSIGALLDVSPRDVILGNSASYGIHLIANGYPWEPGDEVLLMQNDFPSDILPWLALEQKGVRVIQIAPKGPVITPEELKQRITHKTKIFCISEVHTFTGYRFDIGVLADICKQHNVHFILNLSQSAGVMPTPIKHPGVDAVVCAGYKWLCGPYGTGFCWLRPLLREKLALNMAYWISCLSQEELNSTSALRHKEITSARKYDIFATANFFNFVPWKASIDYFLNLGLSDVFAHNQRLIGYLMKHVAAEKYVWISPQDSAHRSGMAVISHVDPRRNKGLFDQLLARNIHPAFWKNNIRIAPHVYNTQEDIDQVLDVLNRL